MRQRLTQTKPHLALMAHALRLSGRCWGCSALGVLGSGFSPYSAYATWQSILKRRADTITQRAATMAAAEH